jgi:ATP-binding cassette subfamily C protein
VQIYRNVIRTYNLLDPKSKVKFVFFTLIQTALGLLDLIAILTLGLFSFLVGVFLGITELPSSFDNWFTRIGFFPGDLYPQMISLILVAVVLIVFKSLMAIIVLKKIFRFLAEQNAKISRNFGLRFMNSTYETISSQPSQEATYAIGRGLHISEILGNVSVLISELAMLSLLMGFTVFFAPEVGAVIFLYFLGIYFLAQKKLGGWIHKNTQILSESNIKGDQAFQEGMSLYKELYVTNKLDYMVELFSSMRFQAAKSTANIQLISYIPKFTFESALIVGACLVGMYSALTGTLQNAITSLVMFFALGSRMLPSILRLQTAANAIQSFSVLSNVSFELLRAIPEKSPKNDNHQVSKKIEFESKVELVNVGYSYPNNDSFSMKDISFTVPVGGSLAIVGKTGCGKSTLVDLLLGVLEPSHGSVLVSGLAPSLAVKEWPGFIGYVPQDFAFLNGTVRQNVAIAMPDIEILDDQVWNCLRLVELEELFSESQHGLDSLIGERGIRLSGGQRQRLGIARALYSNPKLLVLDEATSALDAETEEVISKTIRNLANSVTLIVIAHRITTVQKVDHVIYLHDGQIKGEGSFEAVRTKVPDFEKQASLMGL